MRKAKWLQAFRLLICVSLLAIPSSALAQTSLGGIRGSLQDSSAAVIPGQEVVLVNQETNQTRTTVTTESGLYTFPSLPPGNYIITVERPGFKKYGGSIILRVGQEAVVNLSLEPASSQITVEVQAVTPVIETSGATIADVKESERIKTLPLNGREITSLFTLTAGVSRTGGTQVNGLQVGSVMFLGDGISMEDRYTGDMSRVNPALEGIQEFRIETLNSSAQYSKPATVSYVTKSGTNTIHGSAFETYRSNRFYARDPFSQNKQPPLQRREFGASAGGPVYVPKLYNGKDKTFFFFTYEGLRQPQQNTYHVGSPPQSIREGDFSDYIPFGESSVYKIYDPLTTRLDPATGTYIRDQFPGNKIPASRISNMAQKALSRYPLPNVPGAALDQNLETHLSAGTTRNKYTTKIDQQLGRDTISGSFTFTDEKRDNPRGGVSEEIYFNKVTARTWQVTLSDTHIFSPTIVNEARIGGTRPNSRRGPTIKDPPITTFLGLQNATGDSGWPCLYSYTSPGNLEFGSFYFDDDNPQTAPQFFGTYADNLSITKGKHALRIGGQLRTLAINSDEIGQPRGCYEFPGDWTALAADPTGVFVPGTGSGFASFLLGYPMAGELRTNKGFFYHRQKDFAIYFQDDWKASPRLTLTLGVRYEYYTRYKDKNDQIASYDPATRAMVTTGPIEQGYQVNPAAIQAFRDAGVIFKSASEVGFPSGLLAPDRNDIAPRIGVAYALNDEGTMVIRGGYGISYWTIPLIGLQARSRTNPPFDYRRLMLQYPQSYSYSWVGETDFTQGIPPYVLGGGTLAFDDAKLSRIGIPISMAPFAPDMKDSMAQTWNVTLERQLPSNTGLRLSYVGTRGSNLQMIEPINTAAPQSTMPGVSTQNRRTNPIFGDIATLQTYGYSNSHQLQAEVKRSMSRGLTLQAFYAWNRTLATTEFSAGSSAPTTILGDRQGGIASLDDRIALEYANSGSYPIHQFTMNFLWDLPFGPNQRWGLTSNPVLSRIIGGWQMAANAGMRSGMFFSYGTRNTTRWQTGDPNLPRDQQTVSRFFNTDVFVPAVDQNGKPVDYYTSQRPARNGIEGPGFKNMDFSLFKNTRIKERVNLRIMLDAFNVFNHPSWGQPNTVNGRINSMASSPRLLQFGARLEF
jgi:hypothetical protein